MAKYMVAFVRHGESLANYSHTVCGWYDSPLTEKGREQATQAAEVFLKAGYTFDIAYTSKLTRASDTLKEILNKMNLESIPVVQSWRLNEIHFGDFSGMPRAEVLEKYGANKLDKIKFTYNEEVPSISTANKFYNEILSDPRYGEDFTPDNFPRSETLMSAMNRAIIFWKYTIVPAVKSGKRVLISSHGILLSTLITYLENIKEEDICKIPKILNAKPFVYHFDEDMKPVKPFEILS